ncbi:cutinase family protein [Candidatus Saccharibacteria bacterium]|nr:cutinase family protein [Candidatus Saccharibacteria bacterium]
MKSLFRLLPFCLLFLMSVIVSVPVNSTGDGDCSDFEAIFLRGSGQKIEDSDFKAFQKALEEQNVSSKIEFLDLDYPAVSVSNFSMALSTYLSAGESYKFKSSVENGIEKLKNHIKIESKKCPEKKFILAGYSQGAMVVSKSLPSLNAEKILYAGTFGDPKLYLPEGKDSKNTACKNIGLSNYRVYVPDCDVDEGVLTALNPYQEAGFRDKLGAFCNMNDFMCGSNLNLLNPLKGHLSYDSVNGYQKFAEIVADKIKERKNSSSSVKTTATYSEKKLKDVAVLFDFAQFGVSVADLKQYSISSELKQKLVELGRSGARVAFYNVYSVTNRAELLELVADFTADDIDKVIDKMNYLNRDFRKYNFATASDNIYYALSKISNEARWRGNAEKNIYLITNVCHDADKTSFDGTNYEKALNEMREKKVRLSVISEKGEEATFVSKTLIQGTGGMPVGKDLSKVRYSKNNSSYDIASKIFSKKFELSDDVTLVIVNDVVYGISRDKEITILGLDESLDNSVVLIGYNAVGQRTSKRVYNFAPNLVKVPDCSNAS